MAYDYWMRELSLRRPNTQRSYKRFFSKYLEHVGLTPDELYEWQKSVLEDGEQRTNRDVTRSVVKCIGCLVDEGLTPGSSIIVASAVKSFMEANGLEFSFKTRDLPKGNSEGSRVVKLEEIRLMWDDVTTREKLYNRALLMTLKDSGLRVSDVARLRVEDYLNSLTEIKGFTFAVYRPVVTIKTREKAYIHLGPEACEAIDKHIEDKKRGFIFGEEKYPTSPALSMRIYRIVERVGLEGISAHSFRKTHRTLLEAVMPESYVKKLQGKKTDPYIRPEETGELTEAYTGNYDVLRVFRDMRDYEELRRELEEQRGMKVDLEYRLRNLEKFRELVETKEELEKLRK